MKKEYDFILSNNHVIVDIDKNYALLDTGSPYSFGKIDEINVLNKKYKLLNHRKKHTIIDFNEISNFINYEIILFLGNDILSNLYFIINFNKNK